MHYRLAVSIVLFLLLSTLCLAALDVPDRVELGTAASGEEILWNVTVINDSADSIKVSVSSACECVVPEVRQFVVKGNTDYTLTGTFDTTGYSGVTEKLLLLEYEEGGTERREAVRLLLHLEGEEETEICTTCSEIEHLMRMEALRSSTATPAATDAAMEVITGSIYFSAVCRDCVTLIEKRLPEIAMEYKHVILLNAVNIMEPSGMEAMKTEIDRLGVAFAGDLPLLIIDDMVFRGFAAIEEAVRDIAAGISPDGAEAVKEGEGSAASQLAPIPVFIAGLIDGINPCAFSTLFFLLSVLAMIGRSRKQIAVIGIVFTSTVFITYFAVGLGLFTAFRALESFTVIAEIIRWILFGALLVFAVLSLYDAWLARKGRLNEMVLQLPDTMKKRIHKTIREHSRTTAIVTGSAVIGILVSVFELACTGQIYLPTIVYMTRQGESLGYLLLALYNIGFIIPLVVVFALILGGISTRRAAVIFQDHVGVVKIALAAVFLVMAALILVT